MWSVSEELDLGEMNTRHVIGNLRSAAENVDNARSKSSEFKDRLDSLSVQLWALEFTVRDINNTIAQIHSEHRTASSEKELSVELI